MSSKPEIAESPVKESGILYSYLLLIVYATAMVYLSLFTVEPWMRELNWRPGSFTNLMFLGTTAGMLLILLGVMGAATFAIAKRWGSLAIIVFALGFRLTVPDNYYLSMTDISRLIGYETGLAKKDCWIPESYECKLGKGVKDEFAPKIWDGGFTKWGAKMTLELTIE